MRIELRRTEARSIGRAVAAVGLSAALALGASFELQTPLPPELRSQVERLSSADESERAEGACELGRRGAEAVSAIPLLVERLHDDMVVGPVECGMSRWLRRVLEAKPEEWRKYETSPAREAALALGRIGSPAVVPLTRALGDANWKVRKFAAFALGKADKVVSRNASAVEGLAQLLKDARAEVREATARALGEIENAGTVPALAATLRDEDARVRVGAAWALGEIEDLRAVDGLSAALGDADVDVRRQAAWALGEIEDATAVDALIAALKDADTDVRRQAARALGEIAHPRAVGPLSAALKDEDAEVRKTAAWALGEMRN